MSRRVLKTLGVILACAWPAIAQNPTTIVLGPSVPRVGDWSAFYWWNSSALSFTFDRRAAHGPRRRLLGITCSIWGQAHAVDNSTSGWWTIYEPCGPLVVKNYSIKISTGSQPGDWIVTQEGRMFFCYSHGPLCSGDIYGGGQWMPKLYHQPLDGSPGTWGATGELNLAPYDLQLTVETEGDTYVGHLTQSGFPPAVLPARVT
jgi:hypothetical protein